MVVYNFIFIQQDGLVDFNSTQYKIIYSTIIVLKKNH